MSMPFHVAHVLTHWHSVDLHRAKNHKGSWDACDEQVCREARAALREAGFDQLKKEESVMSDLKPQSAVSEAQQAHLDSKTPCGNCRQPECDHGYLTAACPNNTVVVLDESNTFRAATESEQLLWHVPSRT